MDDVNDVAAAGGGLFEGFPSVSLMKGVLCVCSLTTISLSLPVKK